MSKERPGDVSTTTTGPDATTADWIAKYRQAAADRYAGARGAPTSGPLADYAGYAKQAAGGLGFGMERGLGGIENYTNPYEASVIGGIQGDYARQRELAGRSAADLATKAGAFGGSRSAVLQANMVGDVNRDEASTLANVRQSGFDRASGLLMDDRERAARVGQAGVEGLGRYGGYLDDREREAFMGMERGLGYGGTTTRTVGPRRRSNVMAGALGGAATGAKFGPWGALIGGGLGGIGSLL